MKKIYRTPNPSLRSGGGAPIKMDVRKGNLGKQLEDLLLESNSHYRSRGLASVDQNPRLWLPLKGGAAAARAWKNPETLAVIKNRYGGTQYLYSKKSPVDFSGVARGLAVYFDAKQTNLKSLPFTSIEPHQIEYVAEKQRNGALAGFMIYFALLDRLFFLPAIYVLNVHTAARRSKENRQSISLAQCEEHGTEIRKNRLFMFDWLESLYPTPEKENVTVYATTNEEQPTTQP